LPLFLQFCDRKIEELFTIALAEFDAYTRFKIMAAKGEPNEGLKLLDRLDSLTSSTSLNKNSHQHINS
jgi:hypothetical protein